ncbi:MAG: hypothetical protein COY58_04615 [Gammaproteobacteria bacterium CG_4_10_14_0_8_um_filter_38_16]|nr:MAG: hypothetical protein COY58_04615 [Gammaproteobacteria bacterium CG_4_10_14_0_8_um_filter_38_16]PJA03992.1 MAG: hypothetical protein COX72_02355 [Gammaproteobacteria bacterium CG_4_10_14_0_2_um_filter_38_22]PJB11176.1 MAG: hypothetical protein CO120_01010 [Gammaproteobacteria bacterium CG_4_9_14_3_um_filter_38_9]
MLHCPRLIWSLFFTVPRQAILTVEEAVQEKPVEESEHLTSFEDQWIYSESRPATKLDLYCVTEPVVTEQYNDLFRATRTTVPLELINCPLQITLLQRYPGKLCSGVML